MLKVSQSTLEKFITDPVMAAYVILGMEFDTFQAARLRTYWWCPNMQDNSGVSTGKTAVQFAYCNLRAILCGRLGNHICAVYFPNFQTMKEEFWPYFQATMERSDIYGNLLAVRKGIYGEHKDPGAWWMEFIDGSRITCPAPGFMTDALSSASRRFNTLVVDDYLRAMDMGDGLEKQLLDRVTRPNFNKKHPIWDNHTKLLGHAETPSHKGYNRIKVAKKAISDGSTRHALLSFCHLDWSDKPTQGTTFKRKYCPEDTAREQKKNLPWDQYARQWLGIWSRDGQNYYPEIIIIRGFVRIKPLVGRQYPHEINTLGGDFAPGVGIRSDYSSFVVHRMVEIIKGVELEPNFEMGGRPYHCGFTYAMMPKGLDAPRTAYVIHMLHRAFGFSRIVLDPGGGGLWVYPELKRERLTIDGMEHRFTPLCTRFEPMQSTRQPIISFFKRGADLDPLTERAYLTGDDGFIAYWHLQFRMAWEAQQVSVPMSLEERPQNEVKLWTPDELATQRVLDIGYKQLSNVRTLTDKNNAVILSGHGFPMFKAVGKKDVAYGMWYAWCGSRLVMQANAVNQEMQSEDCFSAL